MERDYRTVAIEALGDATNLQNWQQEATIDLEAIQNEEVRKRLILKV